MEPISETTLQQIEDVLRGIAVPPHEGWLGQTVADLCRHVRALQTERAAMIAYTEQRKDQAWQQAMAYRTGMGYGGYRHWDGQRTAYSDILLRYTTAPPDSTPAPVPSFMDELAALSQEMGDYD
jgi:hypothetical protein